MTKRFTLKEILRQIDEKHAKDTMPEKLTLISDKEMKEVVAANITLLDDIAKAPELLFKVAQSQLDADNLKLKKILRQELKNNNDSWELHEREILKQIKAELDSFCIEHVATGYSGGNNRLRKECPQCWQSLWQKYLGEGKP